MNSAYIAGPLFTEADREYLEKIDKLMRSLGYNTYLPHRDAGIFKRGENNSKDFFKKDKNKITECSLMIAVLNGADIDSGTSWEIGFAYSKGIKILGILDDTRKPSNELLNPMILDSINKIVNSLEELRSILK